MDRPPQHRFLAHDPGVMSNGRTLDHTIYERRQIGDAPNRLNFFPTLKGFDQRDHIHQLAAAYQLCNFGVYQPMCMECEVIRLEVRCQLSKACVVEQNCAENCALYVETCRQLLSEWDRFRGAHRLTPNRAMQL